MVSETDDDLRRQMDACLAKWQQLEELLPQLEGQQSAALSTERRFRLQIRIKDIKEDKDRLVEEARRLNRALDPGYNPRVEEETTTPNSAALTFASGPTPGRRQVTVLFCDLVGSAALSNRLDPEDLSALLNAYRSACSAILERYGAYVARYVGDGILAYVGYPLAFEDGAERAVRGALELIDAMNALNADPVTGDETLAVRIGIATGVVVTGDRVREGDVWKDLAVGQVPNLAARLQGLAEPDNVVIADSTRRLLGDLFELRDLGRHTLKGFDQPEQVWRAVRARPVKNRFEVSRSPDIPLVGRRTELATLQNFWQQTREGHGSIMLISGEAGIGKSRLVKAFCDAIGDHPFRRLYHQCSPFFSNTALYPVVERLMRVAGIHPGVAPDRNRVRLDSLLMQLGVSVADMGPPLAKLLGLPVDVAAIPPDARRQKERIFGVLGELLVRLAQEQPLLVVFEDQHWMDPTTAEMLARFSEQVRSLPVMILVTSRWPPGPEVAFDTHHHLPLERLSGEDCSHLVDSLVLTRQLPPAVLQDILEKTDGVPLFVEECTRALLDSGVLDESVDRYRLQGDAVLSFVPATLQDSLVARLDRLPSGAKLIAQLASTIGRGFNREVLAALAPMDGATLDRQLAQLEDLELIVRHGSATVQQFNFRHALLQEAAYHSLLKTQRRNWHEAIANVLEQRFAAVVEDRPELVAHHLTAAGLDERAVALWLKAGNRASERAANVEAVAHLRKALEILRGLPHSPENRRQELDLLIKLGPALIFTHGPGTTEVAETYQRALDLGDELQLSRSHFATLWGYWRISENFNVMGERAGRLQGLSEELGEPGLILQAHHCQWATRFNLGDPVTCCEHITAGIGLYDDGDFRHHAAIYGGHDVKVCGLGEHALALWQLGYPDQARQRMQACLDHAATLNHHGSWMHALDIDTILHRYLRDVIATQPRVEAMLAFAEQHGFSDHLWKGMVMKGWVMAQQGDLDGGLKCIRHGLEAQQAIGTIEEFPPFYDMLAETLGQLGRVEEGLSALDEILALMSESRLRIWLSELYRRRGELLLDLARPDVDAAEQALGQALAIAKEQQAQSLVLRVAMSWLRLDEHNGGQRGRVLLAQCYRQFQEGWDTVDLRRAAGLLDGSL